MVPRLDSHLPFTVQDLIILLGNHLPFTAITIHIICA